MYKLFLLALPVFIASCASGRHEADQPQGALRIACPAAIVAALDDAQAIPLMTDDGRIHGFKLTDMKFQNFLARIGAQPGDVFLFEPNKRFVSDGEDLSHPAINLESGRSYFLTIERTATLQVLHFTCVEIQHEPNFPTANSHSH